MSLINPEDNRREPWSRITDSRLLRPGDELRLVGPSLMARVAILDAHDPSARTSLTWGQVLGLEAPPLARHHHILLQVEGQPDVISTGMFVGTGEPEELIFPHRRLLIDDEPIVAERERLLEEVLPGSHGLYYVSDREQVSATPGGQALVTLAGKLIIQ